MSKIQFNPADQQISVTGKIGRSGEATVKLDSEVQEIGINLGIIELGATTDYGGAVTLGIAGQSVTLGTQGGEINLGIGGFEVKVEARDCIVTEEKFIFGQLVASRSYPDPGCELPGDDEASGPAELPEVPDPTKIIELPDSQEPGWVIFNMKERYYQWGRIDNPTYNNTTIRTVSNIKEKDRNANTLPFKVVSTKNPQGATDYTYQRETSVHNSVKYTTSGVFGTVSIVASQAYPANTFIWWYVAAFYGKVSDIKNFIKVNDKNNEAEITNSLATRSSGGKSFYSYLPTGFIPLIPKPRKPFLPTGNKPPMNECCEEVLDILEDVKEALGIDRLLKDKFPVSNTFMAPECDPASKTEAKDLYEIIQCLFRMLAHGLIFEPRVAIKDADAAKAGDQEFKTRYLNATGWASAMAEAMLEVKDDGNVSTNMDIRNGFAASQTMVGVADALIRLDAILDCLGITLMPRVEEIQTPYNCFVKVGKGFGAGNERQLDLNQDEATEKLLPDFLKTKINKIKTVEIHPRSESLLEILQRIESNLPPQSNG